MSLQQQDPTKPVGDTASGQPDAGHANPSREPSVESAGMIADPAPLGLGAFALTTFVLSLVNAGVMPADTEPVVLGLALAYGGIAQLLAGMWEFRKGNVFGATAFASYGAFWLSFWAYVTFYAKTVPAADHGTAAGWYLIAWGIFTTLMLLGALGTTRGLVVLFAILALTFFLLAFGALGHNTGLTKVGGVVGLITAATAWYLSIAGVLASTFGRQILPNPPMRQP